MLRLCARRLVSSSRAVQGSLVQGSLVQGSLVAARQPLLQAAVRFASTTSIEPTNSDEIPVLSDPHQLSKTKEIEWTPIINFMNDWYDGRDTLHVIQNKEVEHLKGHFKGVSFYNKAHEWQGCVRWCESLRGGPPSVWLHWMGRDPVEIANTLPAPDANGRYCWSMTFTKRQFILYCNNELLGTRDNMLYQYKHVHKAWFADFEHLNGAFALEGPHTRHPDYDKFYQDHSLFRKFDHQWNTFMRKKSSTDAEHAKHNSWRGGEVRD